MKIYILDAFHPAGVESAMPHASVGTRETQERSSLQVAQQVVDVLNGKPPQNRVA